MRAFWWFKDNAIAGMARPGFNACHWKDLPFEEGVLFGWLGQFTAGPAPLSSFREHLKSYAPKVFPFFGMSAQVGNSALKAFEDSSFFLLVLDKLAARTKAFSHFTVRNDQLHFSVNEERLRSEIVHLKEQGISRIVTLTERHHSSETLAEHFQLHHFSIEDLSAPRMDQAVELAEVILRAEKDKEIIAVHCLAGIGRTSTMLMAAHLHLGHSFEDLKLRLSERNPTFQMLGAQEEFIRAFRDRK